MVETSHLLIGNKITLTRVPRIVYNCLFHLLYFGMIFCQQSRKQKWQVLCKTPPAFGSSDR